MYMLLIFFLLLVLLYLQQLCKGVLRIAFELFPLFKFEVSIFGKICNKLLDSESGNFSLKFSLCFYWKILHEFKEFLCEKKE